MGAWHRSCRSVHAEYGRPAGSVARRSPHPTCYGREFGRAVSFRDGLLVVGSNRAAYVYNESTVCGASSRRSCRRPLTGLLSSHPTETRGRDPGDRRIWRPRPLACADDRRFRLRVRTGRNRQVRASCAHQVAQRRGFRDGFGGAIDMTSAIIVVGGGARRSVHPRSEQQRQLGAAAEARRIRRARCLRSCRRRRSRHDTRRRAHARVPGYEPNPDDHLRVSGKVYGFVPAGTVRRSLHARAKTR